MHCGFEEEKIETEIAKAVRVPLRDIQLNSRALRWDLANLSSIWPD